MLVMHDEAGEDNKVLAVPVEKACAEFAHIQSLEDVSAIMLQRIEHFFTSYKALEPGKWVKIDGWKDQAAAHQEIQSGVDQYNG